MVKRYLGARHPRIFAHIASYRDPECRPTVDNMLARARHPDRVHVCVVMQSEPEDSFLFSRSNVRMLGIAASDSRGACWARAEGYRLLGDEQYVLQTDSHMRFAQDWDVRMLAQLGRCSSQRALLTTYPPAYDPPGIMLIEQTIFLAADRFGHDGHLTQRGFIHHGAQEPRPSALMSANFLFGPSQWVRDVPYDPELSFAGEETTLAARLWTNGWDMFGPSEALVWHKYDRIGRRVHWDDHTQWWVDNERSIARMRHVLAGEPLPETVGRYELGSVRTPDAYRVWSGIDYAARTLEPHALTGSWA